MSTRRKLRVGDPIPPDAMEFIAAIRALPPETRQRVTEFAEQQYRRQPRLSQYELARQFGLTIGHSEGYLAALLAPLRRAHLKVVK
jgi:hypothetical protein